MDIKVNETPIRTSRNFRINNIKIDNIDIPEKIEEFKNVVIDYKKAQISDKGKINENLTYKKGHKKVISICAESDSPYVIKKGKKYEKNICQRNLL